MAWSAAAKHAHDLACRPGGPSRHHEASRTAREARSRVAMCARQA